MKNVSTADATKMLSLKKWADAAGTNLKKLDASELKQAAKATGVSAADVKRLSLQASSFSQKDLEALSKKNALVGDNKTQAPVPQREVFGSAPRHSNLTEAGKAFWHSPYTNADAEVVMKKKGLPDLRAAKDFIGQAILSKTESTLQPLGVTRYLFDDQDNLTRFKRSGFSEADVRTAKQAFGFLRDSSLEDVRGYLGLKLRNKESGYLDGMKMLEAQGITESKYDQQDLMAAFQRAGITDAQVKVAQKKFDFLAHIPVGEVKEYLGLKVLTAADGYDFSKDLLKQIGAGAAAGS